MYKFSTRSFWFLVVFLIANFCVIAAVLLIYRYETQFRLAEERASGLAAVYEENMRLMMGSVESIMRATREDVRAEIEAEPLREFLEATAAELPQLRTLLVLDANGVVIADSRPEQAAVGMDASDRAYFQTHVLNHTDVLFVDRPVESRVDGDWSLPISLGVWDDEGELIGVIVVSVDPLFFSGSLSSFAFDDHMKGYILNEAGTIMTTIPYAPESVGMAVGEHGIYEWIGRGLMEGVFEGRGLEDGEGHLIAYRFIEAYGYVIVFTESRALILETFFWEAAVIGVVLFLLSGVTFVVSRHQLARTQEVQAAQMQLAEKENILAMSLQAAGAGVWVWDIGENLIVWDEAMERMHGLVVGSFGRTYEAWQSCVHPEDLAAAERGLQMCLNGERPYNEEFRIVRPNKEVRYILGQAIALWDEAGQTAVRMVGVNIDVTERREAEARRVEAERLQMEIAHEREMVELKQHFVTSVTHDFRTPLQNILLNTNLLQKFHDQWSSEQRGRKLRQIEDQVEQMTTLLNDVLALSRVGANGVQLSLEPIALELFCKEIWEAVFTMNGGKHRTTFCYFAAVEVMKVDKLLLQQVLVNLLSNAFKYTPEGNGVDFTVLSENGHVIFQVKDEGFGIPAADVKRLFRPFQRASNVGAIQGTGLGLAIAKEYVELHEGMVAVESEEGVGTTFTVKIPHRGS